jgi:uncharacterized delta-60 repeat protein
MRIVLCALMGACFLGFPGSAAQAAEGQLDQSFASGGTFSRQLGFGNYQPLSLAFAEAVQSNGDIVLAGESGDGGGGFDLLVVRLTPSGALDPTFGNGGEVDLNLPQPSPGRDSSAYGVVIQPDGRILVAGDVYVGYQEAAIVRLMPNGSLDSSFGNGGVAEVTDLTARGIALTPGGDMVVNGWWQDSQTVRAFALAELSPSGVPVSGFGSNGVVVDQLDSSSHPQSDGQGVAVDGAGNIYAIANANGNGRLLRFTPGGSADASFGNGGSVSLTSDGEAVALEADGTPLTVGSGRSSSGSPALMVEHVLANGQPDPGFGQSGVVALTGSIGGGSDERADSIAVRPDGAILAASSQNPYGRGPTALWLVTHSGALDTGFGSGGETTLPGDLTALGSETDEKAIVAGGVPSGQQVIFTVDRLTGPGGSGGASGTPSTTRPPALVHVTRVSCTSPRSPRRVRRGRVHRCTVRFRARARTKVTLSLSARRGLSSAVTRTVAPGPRTMTVRLTLPARRRNRLTLRLRAGRARRLFFIRRITVP